MADLTLTYGDIWQAVAAAPNTPAPLARVAALDLPIIVSNALRKLLRKAREEAVDLEASRNALIDKYPPVDGVLPADFQTELAALMAGSVTLSDVRAIKLSELGAADVSAAVLDVLVGTFLVDDLA